ncbi:TPA: hypothetical protein I7256_20825 [Vibrio vulnificus]|nr:hypothetical protein [Vibrio fluvialis]HAS6410392.1 hypothetical protein [Vibrio vulnificus]HAS6414962.1 hypothetical protein [Vibrio vulnificus]
MKYSRKLANQQFLSDVVEMINEESYTCDDLTSAEMAGQYAFDAQTEAGYSIDSTAIEAHLDVLIEAGAEFDYQEAIAHGLALAVDNGTLETESTPL